MRCILAVELVPVLYFGGEHLCLGSDARVGGGVNISCIFLGLVGES